MLIHPKSDDSLDEPALIARCGAPPWEGGRNPRASGFEGSSHYMQLVINTFGASLRRKGDRFVVRAGSKRL